MEAYKEFVNKILDVETEITEESLDLSAQHIGFDAQDIEIQLQNHMEDENKSQQIIMLQQKVGASNNSDISKKNISREEALKAKKAQLDADIAYLP